MAPLLQRAADWNEWSESEIHIQLAGHLRGRALQEWNLLDGNAVLTVLKIKVESWSAIYSKYEHYRLSLASPLEMYSKFVLPNWNLLGHLQKWVGK